MEWLIFVVQLIILAGLGALALFTKNYLPSYTKGKGKNLATREDIEEITDKIESVKIEYAKELEGLKSQLNSKFYAQTVRFEKEFECYKELWGNLVEMRAAFFTYRLQSMESKPEEVKSKSELRDIFHDCTRNLVLSYDKNRPFFSHEVYAAISSIIKMSSIQNLALYVYHKPVKSDDDPDIQEVKERVLAEYDEIEAKMEEVRKTICRRIERLDNPQGNF